VAAALNHIRLPFVFFCFSRTPGPPPSSSSMAELARRIAFIFREAAREGQVIEAVEYQEVKLRNDIN
jgi:hypothetical protein